MSGIVMMLSLIHIFSAIEYENDFVISVFNNGNSADKKKIEDLLKGEIGRAHV